MPALRKRLPALAAFLALAAPAPLFASPDPLGGEELHPVSGAPANVAVADFDRDGWLDVVGADGGTIRLWRNDGSGRLVDDSRPGPGSAVSVASADFDRDGLADLAFTVWDGSVGQVGVMLGRKDGWDPPSYYPAEDQPFDLEIADATGDGRMDLVVAGRGTVSTYVGRGGVKFGPRLVTRRDPSETWPPIRLHLADLDGDGHVDAAMAPGAHTCLELRRGLGDGTFGPAVDLTGSPQYFTRVALSDLDRDGWTDIAMGHGERVVIAWNDRSGGLDFAGRDTLGSGPWEFHPALLASDFDGDGTTDLITSVTDFGRTWLTWYRGLGGRRFELAAASPLVNRGHNHDAIDLLAAADLDRDGLGDVVSSRWGEGAEGVHASAVGVLRHALPEVFQGWNLLQLPAGPVYPVAFEPRGRAGILQQVDDRFLHWTFDDRGRLREPSVVNVAGTVAGTADLDGDGRTDLLMARGADLAIVLMDAAGPRSEETWSDAQLMTPGEFDGLPGLDLLVADTGGASLLINDGTGRFSRIRVEGFGGGGPDRVGTGDIDGDGRDEILGPGPDSIIVYGNRGEGRFERASAFALPRHYDSLNRIRAANLDGIGPPEIAALYGGADAHGLGVVFPDGRQAQGLLAYEASKGLTIADFDLDGRLDLASLGLRDEVAEIYLVVNRTLATGEFTTETRKLDHGGIRSMDAGDFDGDGATDLLASLSTGTAVLFNAVRPGAGAPRALDAAPGPVASERLAIRSVSPNPARAEVALRLASAARGPVRLELFDVAGRRVHDETFALSTAGAHTFRFTPRRELPAGLYLLRAASGRESAVARLAIVR